MSQNPTINGHEYSHTSLIFMMPDVGEELIGIDSLSYKDSLEPGKTRGTKAGPLGRTKGEYNAEGSMSLNLREADNFEKLLGNRFMEKSFTVMCAYADTGMPLRSDELIGVRITDKDQPTQQGNEPIKVTYTLDIMKVLWNGREAADTGI